MKWARLGRFCVVFHRVRLEVHYHKTFREKHFTFLTLSPNSLRRALNDLKEICEQSLLSDAQVCEAKRARAGRYLAMAGRAQPAARHREVYRRCEARDEGRSYRKTLTADRACSPERRDRRRAPKTPPATGVCPSGICLLRSSLISVCPCRAWCASITPRARISVHDQ